MRKTKKAKKTSKKASKNRDMSPEPEDHEADGNGTADIDGQLDSLFEETWGNSEPKQFSNVPLGTYQTRIIAAILNNAKTSGRFQCSWETVIVDGEHRGRHLFKHDGLEDEQSTSYFQGTLATLGYDVPGDKDGLKETLQEIVDAPTYVVQRVTMKKKRGEDGEMQERTNTRFVRVLDSDDVADDLTEEELQSYLEGYTPETDLNVDGGSVDTPQFEKGDRVTKDFDGTDFAGEIKSIKGDTATVLFDDGEKLSVSVDELTAEEPEGSDVDAPQFEKGDRVTKDFDGTEYAGKIKRIKGDTATVLFDDGETVEAALDDLTAEEPEAEPEPEPEPEEDNEPAAAEEPSCSLKKGVSVTDTEEKLIDKLAKKLGFVSDDYPTWEGLLCEIGDYCGLSGQFANVKQLITKAQKAAL